MDTSAFKEFTICVLWTLLQIIKGQTPLDIGFYNGQMVRFDDHGDHAGHGHGGGGLGLGPVGQGGLGRGFGLGGGLGLGDGPSLGGGLGLGGGGLGLGGGLLSGMPNLGFHSTPRCPGLVCPRYFISPSCAFTPVMRSMYGGYCTGCTEDICSMGNLQPGQRRRRRRLRRRLCRRFGICTWDQQMRRGMRG